MTSVAAHRVFRRGRYLPHADSFVSLLVDCSGSMKVYIPQIAVLVDVLGRALQLAGMATESWTLPPVAGTAGASTVIGCDKVGRSIRAA